MITAKIAITLLQLTIPVQYDWPYGGPPMWDRDYRNPEYHRRGPVPQIRGPGGGPEFEPCIRRGDCYGPKYQDRIPQGYRTPPYYDPRRRYEED